jgi:hypothetical protein
MDIAETLARAAATGRGPLRLKLAGDLTTGPGEPPAAAVAPPAPAAPAMALHEARKVWLHFRDGGALDAETAPLRDAAVAAYLSALAGLGEASPPGLHEKYTRRMADLLAATPRTPIDFSAG